MYVRLIKRTIICFLFSYNTLFTYAQNFKPGIYKGVDVLLEKNNGYYAFYENHNFVLFSFTDTLGFNIGKGYWKFEKDCLTIIYKELKDLSLKNSNLFYKSYGDLKYDSTFLDFKIFNDKNEPIRATITFDDNKTGHSTDTLGNYIGHFKNLEVNTVFISSFLYDPIIINLIPNHNHHFFKLQMSKSINKLYILTPQTIISKLLRINKNELIFKRFRLLKSEKTFESFENLIKSKILKYPSLKSTFEQLLS